MEKQQDSLPLVKLWYSHPYLKEAVTHFLLSSGLEEVTPDIIAKGIILPLNFRKKIQPAQKLASQVLDCLTRDGIVTKKGEVYGII